MATTPSRGPHVVRFGVYEADLRAGELRKRGLRIRLPEQPFRLLAILLEHSDEVVTREDLQKRLWPDGTFVDFEQGLNAAVKRLREALGDTAETPRYIETLPRRGYRFIGSLAASVVSPTLLYIWRFCP
jgi:cholera toxin transcriptional activator